MWTLQDLSVSECILQCMERVAGGGDGAGRLALRLGLGSLEAPLHSILASLNWSYSTSATVRPSNSHCRIMSLDIKMVQSNQIGIDPCGAHQCPTISTPYSYHRLQNLEQSVFLQHLS